MVMRRYRRQISLARNYLAPDLAAVPNVDHGKSNVIAKFLALVVSDLDPNALILPDLVGHRKGLGGRLIHAYSIGYPALK